MITEIGITAGDIWHYLDDKESASIDELTNATGASRDRVLMSLGWLSREGHVVVREADGQFQVSLNSKSKAS